MCRLRAERLGPRGSGVEGGSWRFRMCSVKGYGLQSSESALIRFLACGLCSMLCTICRCTGSTRSRGVRRNSTQTLLCSSFLGSI